MPGTLEKEFPKPNPADFDKFEDFLKAIQQYKRTMKSQGIDVAKMEERKNGKYMKG